MLLTHDQKTQATKEEQPAVTYCSSCLCLMREKTYSELLLLSQSSGPATAAQESACNSVHHCLLFSVPADVPRREESLISPVLMSTVNFSILTPLFPRPSCSLNLPHAGNSSDLSFFLFPSFPLPGHSKNWIPASTWKGKEHPLKAERDKQSHIPG